MAKRLNPNLVKIHRNYTVEEVANLFSVHKNTVRLWVKDGLATNDDKRPMLILGSDLKSYLQAKRKVINGNVFLLRFIVCVVEYLNYSLKKWLIMSLLMIVWGG